MSQIYFGIKIYIFRTVPLSIIGSLFTTHLAMEYVIHVCRQLWSKIRMEMLLNSDPARKQILL